MYISFIQHLSQNCHLKKKKSLNQIRKKRENKNSSNNKNLQTFFLGLEVPIWVNCRTDQKTCFVQGEGQLFNAQPSKCVKKESVPTKCLVKLFHKNCALPF